MSGQTTVEVDSGEWYDASSLLTDGQSGFPLSTENYTFENGRRYHAFREGLYLLPNDEKEQDRLDLAHYIFRLVLRGRLHRAPLPPQVHSVLDFGTGTGAWAIDFAGENPDSQVVGIDLSPIQPTCGPPNCRFFVDDIESPWAFGTKFNYIHGRAMAGSIKDWDTLLEQIHTNLEDHGMVEFQEYETVYKSDDDTLTRTPAIDMWQQKFNEASELINQPMNLAGTLRQRLERLKFVDIRDDTYKIPVGPWAKNPHLKEIGYLMLAHCIEGLEAFTLAPFSRVLNWSKVEMRQLMENVKSEMATGSNHLYVVIHFVYGRKPAQAPV